MIVEIRDEVVTLSGALRRNQWETLVSAVNIRLKHHPRGIVVDCGGLESLTPEGANTFRDAAGHIAQRGNGARIVVANIPPHVMDVLKGVPNLRSQLPLAPSVAAARASLGLPTRGQTTADASRYEIVVGLLGTSADADAVALAARLGRQQEKPARLHLTYLLVVPRTVPLLSALGPEEEETQNRLAALDSAVRAARQAACVTRVERTRDPAGRLIEVAGENEVNAALVVLALPPDASEEMVLVADTVLARTTGRDVIVNRLPSQGES